MNKITGTTFLRISMGIMMLLHGIMKLIGGPTFWETLGGLPPMIPDIHVLKLSLGVLATLIELLGGLFLILNFRVREASLAIVLVMIFAFTYHLKGVKDFTSFVRNAWPLEMALVYLSIAFMHPWKTWKRK